MTEPQMPTATPAHALHDPELITALAAREPDLKAVELTAARALVDTCVDCRDLYTDLRAVQVALATSMTPSRPRDFALSAADAKRLRGSGWRRVLRYIGSSRDAFSRPLAIGFTTIGVVALLITAVPSIPLGRAGGGAVLSTVGSAVHPEQAAQATQSAASPAASAAAAPAPSVAAASAAPSSVSAFGPAASSDAADRQSLSAKPEPYGGTGGGVFSGSNEAGGRTGDAQGGDLDSAITEALISVRDDGLSIGFVIAGICLFIGFGLFALRWTSRRFGDG
jgi:hypothetical protein